MFVSPWCLLALQPLAQGHIICIRDNLVLFLSYLYPFFFFPLTFFYNKELKHFFKEGGNKHCYFIPDFGENTLRFSLLNNILAISLSHIEFIMLKYSPSILSFFEWFIINGWGFLAKTFYVPIEMIMWFLSTSLIIWYRNIDRLICVLSYSFIHGTKPCYSKWIFICFWIHVQLTDWFIIFSVVFLSALITS